MRECWPLAEGIWRSYTKRYLPCVRVDSNTHENGQCTQIYISHSYISTYVWQEHEGSTLDASGHIRTYIGYSSYASHRTHGIHHFTCEPCLGSDCVRARESALVIMKKSQCYTKQRGINSFTVLPCNHWWEEDAEERSQNSSRYFRTKCYHSKVGKKISFSLNLPRIYIK